jgi:hypothetical protein
MARPRNSTETVTITISTTPIVRALLETLLEDGTYGKNVAEACDRLLGEKLRELRKGGDVLAERLNLTHKRLLEDSSS